jgi:hypothetical protein
MVGAMVKSRLLALKGNFSSVICSLFLSDVSPAISLLLSLSICLKQMSRPIISRSKSRSTTETGSA